jgi:hypothetical protein
MSGGTAMRTDKGIGNGAMAPIHRADMGDVLAPTAPTAGT